MRNRRAFTRLRPSGYGAVSPARRRRAGFTLIEIMVVVVIIGILAAIVVARVTAGVATAERNATVATLRNVRGQVEIFRQNHQRFPSGLEDLCKRPSYVEASAWPEGGYLREAPKDGWGRDLVYRVPGQDEPFDLVSLGQDGAAGGEGAAADLR